MVDYLATLRSAKRLSKEQSTPYALDALYALSSPAASDTWCFWSGEHLGPCLGMDTETEALRDKLTTPRLALASASNGNSTVIIKPDDVLAFLDLHRQSSLAFHNIAFDYWVLDQHLHGSTTLAEMVDSGLVRDTMLLDELIQIAHGKEPRPRGLDELATDWIQRAVDKNSRYRQRYSELLGRKDWQNVDPGFFEYAAKDARTTFDVYVALVGQAKQISQPYRDQVLSRCQDRFGYLSEKIQVKAAVALEAVHRNGLAIAPEQAAAARKRLAADIARLADELDHLHPGAVKRRKKTNAVCVTSSGVPSLNDGDLIQRFAGILQARGESPPLTGTGRITSSPKYWATKRGYDALIETWATYKEATKLISFFQALTSDRIHPRYQPLVRTGRTSCSNPNIQQLPKAAGFREMVVPCPGSYLFIIDYSAIELRTLAAVCEHKFGQSQLAEIIRSGTDPHCYTAALLLGIELDEFLELRGTEPAKFKHWRQAAKAVAFGVPGGLEPSTLRDYAVNTYGVDLSLNDARTFRHRLIHEVYPELRYYLRHDDADAVCTLTGRVRGGVTFCQAKNAPFQGLAADGMKLALWRLFRHGYRIVAMVHDEVLIELPLEADHASEATRIDRIMCESMEELTGRVPVECELSLSTCWSKHAVAIWDEQGKLQPWSPDEPETNLLAAERLPNMTEGEL